MKKMLPLLFVLACFSQANSQTCVRDSSVLLSGALLAPPFWDTITMQYNLNDACINHPYNQSVTVNVPTTYSGFQLSYVKIEATGAITNLPAGLTYSCDPPNCQFNASTLGCIHLYGTPNNTNIAPDTLDLGIVTKVVTVQLGPNFPITLEFPSQIPGNNHYYLALKNEECLVGTYDQNSQIAFLKTAPNPFSAETTITVEALQGGDFNFEVFNFTGARVHARNMRLDAGINHFVFDGSNLPAGSYFYTIGNLEGKASRKFVIAR